MVEKIRELAKNKGLSLPKLEETLGFGNGTISKWNTGSPNLAKLKEVADYFDVSIDYLIGRSENELDNELRRIQRARNNMSNQKRKDMMKLLEISFEEYFSDDYEDDDLDE